MKHRVFSVGLFAVYIIGMTAIMIWQGIGIDPSRYAFVLLFASLFVKRTRSFILDWTPFLFILLSYDFLRGFADNLGGRANFVDLINLEQGIFGMIPTIELQKLLYSGSPTFLDYLATIFYFLHFALPLGFGFLLWLNNRGQFRHFVTGILLVSYAGWLTFLIYPSAPPWLASNEGYIPKVSKIIDSTLSAFPDRWNLPSIYHNFNPNEVAAMPSLHAAYPFLVLLFAYQFFKYRGLFFLPYVLGVWFSLVYLGEHYIVDVIAGAIYALIAFLVAIKLHKINWGKLFARFLLLVRNHFQISH